MIIKNYQLETNDISKYNFFLFYGDNEGLKNEKTDYLVKKTNYKRFLYNEKEVLNDTESFSNSLLTRSFFDDKKIIIIKNTTDKVINLLKNLINREIEKIIIIFDADILDKRSKLRNFFEKENELACVPFYPDDFKSLNFIA